MAKNTLPVDFQDDILNSAMGGKRRYKIINNSDGTISLEDATTYDQVGSNFGAGQMNATNEAVNAAADAGKIIDDIEVIRNVTKEGYMAGALALKQVDDSLGGVTFHENPTIEGEVQEGLYYMGADSVLKKLGNNLISFSFNITTRIYYSSNPTVLRAELYGTVTIGDDTKDINISLEGYGKNEELSHTFNNGVEIYACCSTNATALGNCELFIKGILPYVRVAGFFNSNGTLTENKHGYLVKTDLGYAIIYDNVVV